MLGQGFYDSELKMLRARVSKWNKSSQERLSRLLSSLPHAEEIIAGMGLEPPSGPVTEASKAAEKRSVSFGEGQHDRHEEEEEEDEGEEGKAGNRRTSFAEDAVERQGRGFKRQATGFARPPLDDEDPPRPHTPLRPTRMVRTLEIWESTRAEAYF